MGLSVYILCCRDDELYVGVTNNVSRRLWQHQSGVHRKSFTHFRRPVTLVYTQYFESILSAIAWEKRIKRWSRKKKEALIRGDEEALSRYSFSRNREIHFAGRDVRSSLVRLGMTMCKTRDDDGQDL